MSKKDIDSIKEKVEAVKRKERTHPSSIPSDTPASDLIQDTIDSKELNIREWDPTGCHKFTDREKEFIRTWLQWENIPMTAQALHCQINEVTDKLNDYYIYNEIRRLEAQLNAFRLKTKIMSLDEMQAYLSSMILDDNVPIGLRLSQKDKLLAMRLLNEVKRTKNEAYTGNVSVIDAIPAPNDLQQLSVDTIKALLEHHDDQDEKNEVIQELLSLIDDKTIGRSELSNLSLHELQTLKEQYKK